MHHRTCLSFKKENTRIIYHRDQASQRSAHLLSCEGSNTAGGSLCNGPIVIWLLHTIFSHPRNASEAIKISKSLNQCKINKENKFRTLLLNKQESMVRGYMYKESGVSFLLHEKERYDQNTHGMTMIISY
jgi:hypothetical protein